MTLDISIDGTPIEIAALARAIADLPRDATHGDVDELARDLTEYVERQIADREARAAS